MQDNGTVQQLSKALNQLLDAYEKLQVETKQLKEEIVDLELKNNTLDSKLGALNDTTNFHSTEMDTMLGRIENILGSGEDDIIEEVDTTVVQETTKENKENIFYQKEDENKEINLGRMQSLLNGFNN